MLGGEEPDVKGDANSSSIMHNAKDSMDKIGKESFTKALSSRTVIVFVVVLSILSLSLVGYAVMKKKDINKMQVAISCLCMLIVGILALAALKASGHKRFAWGLVVILLLSCLSGIYREIN